MHMISRLIAVFLLVVVAETAGAGKPLEPVDTSSPRATVQSFLTLTEEAAVLYNAYREAPSPLTQDALWQISDKARRLLDLSRVPPAAHRKVADETFYLLWELIGRVELPDLAEIPGADFGQGAEDNLAQLTRWRIPGTEITIDRIGEGPHAGEFQFSSDTVKQVPHLYRLTRDLPYLRPMLIENVYMLNEQFTGWMIPLKWVEALPAWSRISIHGQVLWKWFALLLLIALAIVLVIAELRWARRKRSDSSLRSYLRRLSVPLTMIIAGLIVWHLGIKQINVTGLAAVIPDFMLELAYSVAVVWIVWVSASWIAEIIIASLLTRSENLDASLIRLTARFIGIMAVLVFMFRAAHNVGIPVYGLVAGAGVGGLAIALAARTTLENFMGTLNLFLDRPVREGDLCRYDEDSVPGWRPVGKVESIGLRSTRIRRFDRSQVTIPNAQFAQQHIVNMSRCERFLLNTTLGLRYETSDDQLRYVLAQLRELLHAHPKTLHTHQDPVRVRFIGFGEFSLDVAVRVYIGTRDYNEFLAIQEDILLRVMKLVKQAGTGFAFPSRTIYVRPDDGLDQEGQQAAEKQVREWAAAQTLPFPDLPEDYRKNISDTLDYPPEGSPDADNS
jgi:MscS family membrane protein